MSFSLKRKARDAFGVGRYNMLSTPPFENEGASLDIYKEYHNRCSENFYGRTRFSLDRVTCIINEGGIKTTEAIAKDIKISIVSAFIKGPRNLSKIPGKKPTHSQLEVDLLEGEDKSRMIIRPTKHFSFTKWKRRRMMELKKAISNAPDIICFPEFSFPPLIGETDFVGYTNKVSYINLMAEFEREMIYVIKDSFQQGVPVNRPFIFMGSYHCPIDYYNLGVIYPLGDKIDTHNVFYRKQSMGKEPEDIPASTKFPIFHRKRFPASRANERFRVPPEVSFCTYLVNGLRIGVLICADLVDLNQFLNMVRLNSSRTERIPLDFILIPSYNSNEVLKSMSRELSFLCSTTVIYSNANPYYPEFPCSEIYCCGYNTAEMKEIGFVDDSLILSDTGDEKVLKSSNVRTILFNGQALNDFRAQFRKYEARLSQSSRAFVYPR
ncbi:MAG: hypothetical protein Tsb002_03700 [Wenzhouxiangellaceae bacterium]